MQLRQIATVALVLALTIAGFIGARLLGERDARRDSEHRAEVAAAQIRGRVEQGASLAESLRRFMAGVAGIGVTGQGFQTNASRWLSPAGFPAAGWVQQVAATQRRAYERRIGHPIVTRDPRGRLAPVGPRPSYLPATLVSGVPPMVVPGIDLGGDASVAGALTRASTLYDAGATPLETLRDGTKGLFLIKLAPRLSSGIVRPGFVVVFVSELWLRSAVTDTASLQLTVGDTATAHRGTAGVRNTFTEAGQRFAVVVPRRPVQGAAAVLPWIILAAGIVLAALAGALGVNAARRTRAQDEADRIFTLSPDLIVVAGFDGYFKRVNPAVKQVLGYTEEELLGRPYLDFVHPDDRDRTETEATALTEGKMTLAFENRFACKDGSYRVLDWTSTPVVDQRVMYGMARDVTERRQAETELGRLVGEQAALRRVATLVARGVPAAEVFAAVAEEVERLLDAQATAIGRLEPDGTMAIVASRGTANDEMPVGSHLKLESHMALSKVVRTGRSARVDDYSHASELVDQRLGIRCAVAVPIMVEGSLWGSIASGTNRERFPDDAEQRMAEFTELAGAAIANAESRSELTASRARIVAASDATRRQIERDLHDGAQQRLVHTVVTLKLARRAFRTDDDAARALVAEALDHAEEATGELRELVQGILPPVLTRSGLHAAVVTLARRMPLPVDNDVTDRRLPAEVEATAYFVVAEALTNVAKHSGASRATVVARVEDSTLELQVRDDGVGGARRDGSGFVGLADRLAVHDGELRVQSPPGGGTIVVAEIPLGGH
jgi:PAS domain S-box-containing protein